MKHRIKFMSALGAALALSLSLAAPAFADQTCTWVVDRWVCVPPEGP